MSEKPSKQIVGYSEISSLPDEAQESILTPWKEHESDGLVRVELKKTDTDLEKLAYGLFENRLVVGDKESFAGGYQFVLHWKPNYQVDPKARIIVGEMRVDPKTFLEAELKLTQDKEGLSYFQSSFWKQPNSSISLPFFVENGDLLADFDLAVHDFPQYGPFIIDSF